MLFAYPQLPGDVLGGRLAERRASLADRGRDRPGRATDKADFWSAVGGAVQGVARLRRARSRASPARATSAGPRCAPRRCARASATGRPRRSTSCTASAASVRDSDGEPVADAWVALPEPGAGRRPTPTAASGFDASRPASTRWSRAPATAPRPRPRSRCPGARARPRDRRGQGAKERRRADRTGKPMAARIGCPPLSIPRAARRGGLAPWSRTPAARVLLGNLEPMVRAGHERVLDEDGVEVIGQEQRAAGDRARPGGCGRTSSCSTSTGGRRASSASASGRPRRTRR